LWIRRGSRQSFGLQQRANVEAGAANNDRLFAATAYVFDGPARVFRPLRGGVIFMRLANVDEVMPRAMLLCGRGLSSANVQTPINLHRVGRQDFTV
jgi:hypothetical protein